MKLNDPAAFFIVTADMHVDEHAWVDRPQIRDDAQLAFRWIVDLGVENNLSIIAAGDVLDSQLNESGPPGFIRNELRRLKLGVFYFLQGQHDRQERPWLKQLSDNAFHLDAGGGLCLRTLDDNNPKMVGIDWTPAAKLPERLAQIPPGTDIVVMHQVCQELMGSIALPEMSVQQVPHAKLLILGDYHKHKAFETVGASGQKMTVLSPGSTNMRSIDEPAEKYVFIVRKDLSYYSLRIPTRLKYSVDLYAEEFLEEFVKTAREQIARLVAMAQNVVGLDERLHKPLLRVRFDPEIPLAYQRIHDAVGDAAHLFTGYLSADSPKTTGTSEDDEETLSELSPAVLQMQQQLEAFGVAGCLPLVVDEELEPEVYNICQQLLLEQADPVAILTKCREEFFVSSNQGVSHAEKVNA